jgi:hypothetical protein
MLVDQFELYDYRDKTLPYPTNHVPIQLPVTHLQALPFTLTIDSINVQDAHIVYEEYVGTITPKKTRRKKYGKTIRTGVVELSDMEGSIYNITNDPERIAKDQLMRVNATAQFMEDGGKAHMEMSFVLNDPNNSHFYEGWIGDMPLQKLNPLLEEMTLLRIVEGNSKGMYFRVVGNNDYAYGNMHFRYTNLVVEILKEKHKRKTGKLKKKTMVTSLANAVVINQDNPRMFKLKAGTMYFERDYSKSPFNFLAKTILSGILSSTGVKNPKVQDKSVEEKITAMKKMMRKRKYRRKSKYQLY